MGWLIKSIMSTFLDLFCALFQSLSVGVVATIGCNVGANFPTIANPDVSFSETLKSFFGNSSSSSGAEDVSSMGNFFDAIFPMGAFKNVMIIIGLTIVVLLVLWELTKGLTGGVLGPTEDPANIILRFIIAIAGVCLSYQIFLTCEYAFNNMYIEFQKVAFSKKVIGSDLVKKGFDYNTIAKSTDITKDMNDSISFLFSSEDSVLVDNLKRNVKDPVVIGPLKNLGSEIMKDLFMILVSIFGLFAILINYLKLTLEVIERYVVLGVMFYTCPLAFSSTATKNSSSIFWSWVRMVFSEMLLMMFSLMFLTTFVGAMRTVSTGISIFGGAKNLTVVQYMVVIFMLVAWLLVGQHVDEYMKGLGLNTAQTGRGLAAELFGAYKVGKSAAKMAAKPIKSVGRKVSAARGEINTQKQKDETSGKLGMQGQKKGKEATNSMAQFGMNRMDPNQQSTYSQMMQNAKQSYSGGGVGAFANSDGSIGVIMTDEARNDILSGKRGDNPAMKAMAQNAKKVNPKAEDGEGAWISSNGKGSAAKDVQKIVSQTNAAGAKSLSKKMEAAGAKGVQTGQMGESPLQQIKSSSGTTLYGSVDDFSGMNPARLTIDNDGNASINDFSNSVSFRDANGNCDVGHIAVAYGTAKDISSASKSAQNAAMATVGSSFGLQNTKVYNTDGLPEAQQNAYAETLGFAGLENTFSDGDLDKMIPVTSTVGNRAAGGYIMPTDMVSDEMIDKYGLRPHNVSIGESAGDCSADQLSCVYMSNAQIQSAMDSGLRFNQGDSSFSNFAYDGKDISAQENVPDCDFKSLFDGAYDDKSDTWFNDAFNAQTDDPQNPVNMADAVTTDDIISKAKDVTNERTPSQIQTEDNTIRPGTIGYDGTIYGGNAASDSGDKDGALKDFLGKRDN